MKSAVAREEQCIFCRTQNLEILISARDLPDRLDVLRCGACDLVFLASRSGMYKLDREETAYWEKEEQKKIYLSEKVKQVFLKEFDRRLDTLSEIVLASHRSTLRNDKASVIASARSAQSNPQAGKLLDVGCGVGHFLDAARRKGWQVKGLDISDAARDAAKEAYGIDVEVGTLEDASFETGEFDAITLWDVIEHIRRPIENLRSANRMLRSGGILVMKTPNEGGLFKGLVRAAYRWFGPPAAFLLKYVYYVPHYFSYSRKSMDALLARCGFEVIRYEIDETPEEFGTEKINAHYKKDPKRKWVIALLPFVLLIARITGRGNKLIVYARKVKDI